MRNAEQETFRIPHFSFYSVCASVMRVSGWQTVQHRERQRPSDTDRSLCSNARPLPLPLLYLILGCCYAFKTAQEGVATKRYRSLPLLKRSAATTSSAVLDTGMSL